MIRSKTFIRLFSPCCAVLAAFCLSNCATEKFEHITAPTGIEFVEGGKALVQGLAACGACHGARSSPDAPLSGGLPYEDIYGERTVPNITPSRDALGSWNTDQLIKYFRFGESRSGEPLSQIPHRGMEWMADEDLLGIIAYLRTLSPVKSESSFAPALTFLDRNTSGFFQGRREITGFIPSISKKSGARYGQYLVENVAMCGRCHDQPDGIFSSGEPLAGGKVIENSFGEKEAPGITGAQLEGWNEEQIVAYLQSGARPRRSAADSRFCPVEFYRNAPSQDLRSIAQYLRTLTLE